MSALEQPAFAPGNEQSTERSLHSVDSADHQARPQTEHVSRDDYRSRVEAILTEIPAKSNDWKAREAAWATYVDGEASSELALLGSIILRGALDAQYIDEWNAVDAKLKSTAGRPVHEVQSEKAEKASITRSLIETNHGLRDFIGSCVALEGSEVTLADLTGWYERALGGKAQSATARVLGAASEVAIMSALKTHPELISSSIIYGDVDQDAAGMDVLAQHKDGTWITFDIKTGAQMPEVKPKEYGVHMVIGIQQSLLDKHGRLDEQGQEGVIFLVNLAIKQQTQASKANELESEVGAVGFAAPMRLANPVDAIVDTIRNAGKNEYQQRADELIKGIRDGIARKEAAEAVDYLRDEYLDRPQDDIELQRLTQIILRSRQQALLQDRLNEDRESLHHDPLTHEEYVSVGGHYEMLRREACEFNHSIRLLMENNGHHFTRDQLTEWIGQASQGRFRWAEGEVTGATSELAVHAALQGMPELKEVRYGSVDEDLAGYDFVCQFEGKLLSIDAKTGHYPPVEEQKHGHKHIEVSVPREVIKNFSITRRGLERIRHDVRNALDESSGNVHHVNHRYYQKG